MMRMLLSFLVMIVALPVFADDMIVRQISVMGEASRTLEPDLALINFTIESRDIELGKTKQMQDDKLNKLYALASKLKIDKKDMRTQHARLNPEYRYNKGKRIFQGYISSVTIVISLDEMQQAAQVMQELVEAGYDRVNNIQYRIKNDQPIRENLKVEALKNAQNKAKNMANAVGMKIGKPIQITENGAARIIDKPVMMRAMAAEMAMAKSAPQAPPAGEQEIRQTISVIFEMIE